MIRRVDRCAKSVLDYGVAVPALLVFAPALVLIALLIRLDSPGSVIYRRRVLGMGGKQFDAFKFRTMYVDGDRLLAERPELLSDLYDNHKLKQDPRITRVGRWLRKYSLDELPQLFNVVLGEMSLVGPRMISPPEIEKYGKYRSTLLTVKPGLTGLWQVSGRSDISYAERVKLDVQYIHRYTIWRDLDILFIRTVPAVVKSRGAY